MKFAQNFKEILQRDEYPQEWVNSAISYKKLKKCIKRVQEELLSLGLDHQTLEKLWRQESLHIESSSQHDGTDRKTHYQFLVDGNVEFTPKLTIALDPVDGSPLDAWLSPDTRRILRKYGRRRSSPVSRMDNDYGEDPQASIETFSSRDSTNSSEASTPTEEVLEDEAFETVEIPLTSDSEFFKLLRHELSNLDELQRAEQKRLEGEIVKLGGALREIQQLASKKKKSKEELEAWREIFRLYIESEIFFSSHELDAGGRDAVHAEQQLTYFSKTVSTEKQKHLRLTKEGAAALETFMRINIHLLKLMKYQEINKTALTKIMKKFDKRTALHAKEGALAELNKAPFIAQDLAKASCFTISNELLNIIPQLDDYLCPVCFTISWKPRNDKDNCPLCRNPVVLEATSDNLDQELIKFLKQNFRDEVKEKQRQNEIAAGVEAFGPGYTGGTHRCSVM